jgi:putative Mg2+ transporter-C (MgtC) family protein
MFSDLPINLQELNFITILFRMALAILIGGIIGTERDIKHRAAGLRTHILVCFGAAVVMMTNEYVYNIFPDAGIDVTRMGAQVVSGIGFIGAGTILVTNENRIKGLTTAAGLWAAAAIGLAIGIGFYEIAIAGGLAIIGIVTLLRPIKRFIQRRTDPADLTVIVHSKNGFRDFLEYTSSIDVKIANLDIQSNRSTEDGEEDDMIFMVTISLGDEVSKDMLVQKLKLLSGIDDVVEVRN